MVDLAKNVREKNKLFKYCKKYLPVVRCLNFL